MQQVGTQHFAAAQAVDPRQLPVPVMPFRRKALAGVAYVWVMHRRVVIRVIAAMMVLVVAVGLLQARHVFEEIGHTAVRLVQGEFAALGFGIAAIEVSGQKLTSDADIALMMALAAGSSTLTFDPQKAMARLHWLRAVETATVRKIYPDRIIVEITEREPVLRWRVGDSVYLVDAAGRPIAPDPGGYSDLPLVVGDGAAEYAVSMMNTLGRHENLTKDLAALSRIGNRRWDLIYYTGLRVQLPEQGIARALEQLDRFQRDYALLDRDVTLIDLRVPGFIALKPTTPIKPGTKKP